jgi:hypothetical protein
MNKLFFLILFVGFSSIGFSQQGKKEAISLGKEELVQAKNVGIYTFTLPEGNTPEKVSENAKYYTMYFKVKYNADSREAALNMVSNDEKSRHVICRFLVASGVDKVLVDGKAFQIEEYFQSYLK